MDIPASALAHHLRVVDEGGDEIEELSDEMRSAIFALTEAARRADEHKTSERAAKVRELTSDLDCELDHPTAVELSEILSADIEAARIQDQEDISGVPLADLEQIAFEISGSDPGDEEDAAAIDGAIEALLFAMKELYQL